MCRHTLHNGTHIVLSVVFRNLRHNHVALSRVAPDDLVNLIHNAIPTILFFTPGLSFRFIVIKKLKKVHLSIIIITQKL